MHRHSGEDRATCIPTTDRDQSLQRRLFRLQRVELGVVFYVVGVHLRECAVGANESKCIVQMSPGVRIDLLRRDRIAWPSNVPGFVVSHAL